MIVSGVNQRRTSELVDDLAHQAGVVDKDHHVSGSTTMKSGAQLHKERHGDASAKELGVDPQAEIDKVDQRQPPAQPFRRAG